MSRPLEHDYIGLSEVSSLSEETSEIPSISREINCKKDLNFKATELRLGPPGSESPAREESYAVKGLSVGFSGAKRGFSVAIDTDRNSGRGKWVLGGNGGSDVVDLAKMGSSTSGGGLFSPRGVNVASKSTNGSDPSSQDTGLVSPVASRKDGTVAPGLEEKAQGSIAGNGTGSASKAQVVVGWPPIRSYRKNSMATNIPKIDHENKESNLDTAGVCLYVKVSMDGAPYLRKVDLKTYGTYAELSSSLEKMFSCFTIGQYGYNGVPSRDGLSESRLMDLLHGSEYVLTYEDKDGDWMLVGDVPWDMFTNSCKRLRIMKSSEAIGLAPRAMGKCKSID